MGLSNRGKQPLISVFRFDDGFIGLRNVFLEGNRVPQLTFPLALEFLKARKIGSRCDEMPRCGGKLDSRIFTCF
jgi:hypothetical protein